MTALDDTERDVLLRELCTCTREAVDSLGEPDREIFRRRRVPVRTILLAAVLTMLLTSAAFAVYGYVMQLRTVEEEEVITGRWLILSDSGEILEEQHLYFPDAGMVLNWTSPESEQNRNLPELRCYYLPSEATAGYTDEEGWTRYLADEDEGASIPYIVRCSIVNPKATEVINGKTEVVKEFDRGGWHVTEIISDYTETETYRRYPHTFYERANFILMFDAECGYKIEIIGTSGLEVLEHIMEELEIRESSTAPTPLVYDENSGVLQPGCG